MLDRDYGSEHDMLRKQRVYSSEKIKMNSIMGFIFWVKD